MNRSSRLYRRHARASRTPRRGFAMMMALGALVIIAVLIAGSSYISLQETRLGQNQLVQARALAAAEYGLNKIQADWDKTPNLQMDNGDSYDMEYSIAGQGACKVRMTRLNDETFWLVSEGRAASGDAISQNRTAVKRVGAIIRLRIPTVKANAAITANGSVNIGGSVSVVGLNTNPPNWTGCSGGEDKVGIVVPTGDAVTITGNNATNAQGWTTADMAGESDTYIKYGDETWESLKGQANHIVSGTQSQIQPSTTEGSCNKSDPKNWGEPARAEDNPNPAAVPECNNYFPIIYASSSVTITGRRGQGILLVEGDLTINGDFDWTGIIIVKDDLIRGSGNAKIYGAIMAANEYPLDDTNVAGSATYAYSACALERALRGSASVLQAKDRAWAELY